MKVLQRYYVNALREPARALLHLRGAGTVGVALCGARVHRAASNMEVLTDLPKCERCASIAAEQEDLR